MKTDTNGNPPVDPAAGRPIDPSGTYDPETGEVYDDDGKPVTGLSDADIFDAETVETDGVMELNLITMGRIAVDPGRAKAMGPNKIAIFSGIASGTEIMEKADGSASFVALVGQFGAVKFDKEGNPEGAYKADKIFLPIGHSAALDKLDKSGGSINFSIEYSAVPSGNPHGFSWQARNLAKLDRENLSPLDRLMMHSVKTSQALALTDRSKKPAGLIELMR